MCYLFVFFTFLFFFFLMIRRPPRSTLFPSRRSSDLVFGAGNHSRAGRRTAGGYLLAGSKYPDRKSTRLNSSHQIISYAVFCLKKKKNELCILLATNIYPRNVLNVIIYRLDATTMHLS